MTGQHVVSDGAPLSLDASFASARFRLHLIPTLSHPFLLMGSDCVLLQPLRPLELGYAETKLLRYVSDATRVTERLNELDYKGVGESVTGLASSLVNKAFSVRDRFLFEGDRPMPISHDNARFILDTWDWELLGRVSPLFESLHAWVALERGARAVVRDVSCVPVLQSDALNDAIVALFPRPPCKSVRIKTRFFTRQVVPFLEEHFNLAAVWEHNVAALAKPPQKVNFTCADSGTSLQLPLQAFHFPSQLAHTYRSSFTRAQVDSLYFAKAYSRMSLQDDNEIVRRDAEVHSLMLSHYPELAARFSPFTSADVCNDVVSADAARVPKLRVLRWHGGHGKNWCEVASLLSPTTFDVALLSGFDLGLHRSGNAYTIRRLAYAVGLNFAFAPTSYLLTKGKSWFAPLVLVVGLLRPSLKLSALPWGCVFVLVVTSSLNCPSFPVSRRPWGDRIGHGLSRSLGREWRGHSIALALEQRGCGSLFAGRERPSVDVGSAPRQARNRWQRRVGRPDRGASCAVCSACASPLCAIYPSLSVCPSIWLSVSLSVCLSVCLVCIFLSVCLTMYVCMYGCMYVCMYGCMYVCMSIHLSI